MGAWIETGRYLYLFGCKVMSLPTWERGLKPSSVFAATGRAESLPTWERGLKRLIADRAILVQYVAPHVGAWIETISVAVMPTAASDVAPHVGAWIETQK